MITVEIKKVKLAAIKLNPNNPRTISTKDMGFLIKSLQDFPEMMNLREIVVDETMMVLGGNMRLLALRKIGAKEADIKIVTGLSLEQKREFIIKDNSLFGDWDFDALANSWSNLPLADWGVDLPEDWLAATPGDTADAEPQIDRAEELNKIWKCETGQLWTIRNHRLLVGDSTKAEDVARVMGGEKADILLTDPPYGINIVKGIGATGGAKEFGRVGTKSKNLLGRVRQPGGKPKGVVGGKGIVEPRLYHPVIGDDKPFDPEFLMDYAPILILFGANHYASRLPDAPCWLVWDKGVSPDSTFSACELAWVNVGNHVKRYEHRWSGMVRAGNRHDELADRIHPTQKPVGLMVQILNDYVGNNVLDIFLGSGSTMVAVENVKRRCFGIEISPEYIACILQRMTDAFPGIEIKRLE